MTFYELLEQVIDLLDSVLKGYPIGSLLFWLTNTRLRSERNIGGFQQLDSDIDICLWGRDWMVYGLLHHGVCDCCSIAFNLILIQTK